MQIRGLVIEDDAALREMLCSVLAALGIEARGVDRERGIDELRGRQGVDVIVGDVAEPVADPRSGLRRLRPAPGNGLVLFSTSDPRQDEEQPQAESHIVRSIYLQAIEHLVGKLHRRLIPPDRAPPVAGVWTYDAARWKLVAPNGRTVQLSLAESQMIRCLFERKGDVVTREDLLTALARPRLKACSRNLDVTVSRLRKKVELLCRQKLPLTSARGRGYAFDGSAEIVA